MAEKSTTISAAGGGGSPVFNGYVLVVFIRESNGSHVVCVVNPQYAELINSYLLSISAAGKELPSLIILSLRKKINWKQKTSK